MAKKDSTIVKSLENDIEKIKNALDKIMNDIETIQDGNDGNPYWNGKNAYNCLNSILKQYDREFDLLNKVEDCFSKIEK